MTAELKTVFKRLHESEEGDIPVGPILLIGLIVIPLVIFLIAFGEEIQTWFSDQFTDLKGKTKTIKTTP